MLSNVVRARAKGFVRSQVGREQKETNLFDTEGDAQRFLSRLSDKVRCWVMEAPPLAVEAHNASSSASAPAHADTAESLTRLLEAVHSLLQKHEDDLAASPSAPASVERGSESPGPSAASLSEYSLRIRQLMAAAKGMATVAATPLF